jgi:hypothetical protein
MKNFTINKYTNYFNGEAGINFTSYYTGVDKSQDPLSIFVFKNLPKYITTVINFGCASGRDFVPFQDSFQCIGFDIAPIDAINWVCKTDNLIYYECSIEDFLYNIDIFKIDWKNSVIYTQGTLMYVSHENQNLFIKKIIDYGCKNIVLSEYEPGNSGYNPYLNLHNDYLKLFEKKSLREHYYHNPTSHIMLDI